MKYKMDIDVKTYTTLVFGEHLEELNSNLFCELRTAEYKHKATGVIIKLQESWEEIDHLYAESDDEEAMNDFKDHLKIISIN